MKRGSENGAAFFVPFAVPGLLCAVALQYNDIMKQTLAAVMVSVGTMIGAGYASGQEVAAYFGSRPSAFVPVICGVLMFALTAVLLGVGAKTAGGLSDVNRALFGACAPVADMVMTANATIVLSAMMAGTDAAASDITGVELPYGVALCLIGIYVVRHGGGGLARANTAMVPCIAVTLAAVCIYGGIDLTGAFSVSELPMGFAYVSMNLLLGAGVLVTRRGMTRGQILAAGALSALVISGLLALICGALPFAPSAEMPLMAIASRSRAMYALYSVCLLCSIFTTMIGALGTVRDKFAAKGKGGEGMLAAAFAGSLISVFGFGELVSKSYPAVGALGCVYVVRCAAFLLAPRIKLFRERHRAVHQRRERAQRHGGGHDEIGIEHLTAVYDEIAQTRARNEVFAHDRTHPAQTDVYLEHGEKGGDGGGQHRVAQQLQPARAHGTEQEQLIRGGGA